MWKIWNEDNTNAAASEYEYSCKLQAEYKYSCKLRAASCKQNTNTAVSLKPKVTAYTVSHFDIGSWTFNVLLFSVFLSNF
ncbi:hypothetical protein A4R26_04505 [Niastella populi]|uniref:Uncharacterized protein n=1 Tax=Niastella populi TaxID=550983 RepID=A0A1V9FE00_9BACT|nr:hypothetical protein A4R26_04505 [Niastella populi]